MSLLLLFSGAGVAGGSQNLDPALFTDADTFSTHTVNSTYALVSALFTNNNTFPTAAVASRYTITPALFTEGDTFLSATILSSYTLTPTAYSDSDSFFTPTVLLETQELFSGVYSNLNIFYTLNISGGRLGSDMFLFRRNRRARIK